NIELITEDDALSSLSQSFDLIHSSLVLQHIKPHRGMRLIEAMAKRVATGGYLVIQFFDACYAPLLSRGLAKLRYILPPVNWARNLYRRRPIFEPPMQLHVYDLSRVLDLLVQLGLKEVHQEFTRVDDGQFESVLLVARKSSAA
ncbi:MAG: hypothetical protein GTO40_07825, partial [Deltaproteobacteria bacterium]|nr:hypothetical protein [Deltaproteobacteria bacterium]